jgi:hypothetical protein
MNLLTLVSVAICTLDAHKYASSPNNLEENSGKRKRNEDKPKEKSLKGMMDSYYSSKTRQDLASTAPIPPNLPNQTAPSSSNSHHPSKKHVHFQSSDSSSAQTETHLPQQCPADHSSENTTITHPIVDDALQTMLMAWYQSGYATGRYQTLLEFSHLLPPVSNKIPVPEGFESSQYDNNNAENF